MKNNNDIQLLQNALIKRNADIKFLIEVLRELASRDMSKPDRLAYLSTALKRIYGQEQVD